ncbi:hypothetical protein [Victivallis sp. Marseille-Q1083]|uniref:hypothetical protein n=1 Tax=Victivallis sp. Marseille-Q1083 TaxID=2717288 RepID=UPI00158F214C|nr:hypothetical protein [Victivallis sp. Marseille-Q1083]
MKWWTILAGPLLGIGILTAAELSDEEWAELRRAAIERERRVIVNNDGCDATEFPEKLPANRENFYRQMLDYAKGCEIDTITYCPFAVGHTLITRSLVTEMHLGSSGGPGARNIAGEILSWGTDALQLAVEFCRANRLEIFVSMRVNDCHDQWYSHWLPGYKRNHPELLCGTPEAPPPYGAWTAFDFARTPVRERFGNIIEELLSRYDVDGLELDFFRFPTFFKSVAWGGIASDEERAAFTELMRRIRRDADRIGRARGKYQLIAIRVPDSVGLCREMGLDLERWLADGLVDILIPAADWGRFSPLRESVELAGKYRVKCYPSVDTSWVKSRDDFNRNTIAAYTAQSAAALAAGADGVYYFNMFYVPQYFPSMRREWRELALLPKTYFVRYQDNSSFAVNEEQYCRIARLTGQSSLLCSTEPLELLLELGDDYSEPAVAAERPELALLIAAEAVAEAQLQASLNGHELTLIKRSDDGVYAFRVEPQFCRPGENMVALSLASAVSNVAETIMSGRERLTGARQPPWRRLFAAHDFANAETIVDGALRLVDSGDGAQEIANLLYPLPEGGDLALKFSFQMKLESSTAPDAVAVRLADGRQVALVTFEPETIGLKFVGKQVPFRTDDRFHAYELEMRAGRVRLTVDGTILFDEVLNMPVEAETGRLRGNTLSIPQMNERSLLFGSLSGPGTGAALWKDMVLEKNALMIWDCCLQLKFRGRPDAALEELAVADWPVQFEFASRDGVIPSVAGLSHNYQDGFLTVESDGFVLNHENPDNPWQYIEYRDADLLEETHGILAVEWQLEVLDGKPDTDSFQMVIRPQGPEESVWDMVFRFHTGAVETPWGTFPTAGDDSPLLCRALLNLESGMGMLLIDGRVIGEGTLEAVNAKRTFFWGDGSERTAGVAKLGWVRAMRMTQAEFSVSDLK